MKVMKKGQAALEFLMTYGWAILVVLVAIGALAYFGVLSPDKFLPNKCTLPAGIACSDFKVSAGATPTTGTADIVLRNGMGFDIGGAVSPNEFKVTVGDCTGDYTSASSVVLANGAQTTFAVTGCSVTAGSKFSGDVNVTYTNTDSGLKHEVQGSLTTRVE